MVGAREEGGKGFFDRALLRYCVIPSENFFGTFGSAVITPSCHKKYAQVENGRQQLSVKLRTIAELLACSV